MLQRQLVNFNLLLKFQILLYIKFYNYYWLIYCFNVKILMLMTTWRRTNIHFCVVSSKVFFVKNCFKL